MLPPLRNSISDLQAYWIVNHVIVDSTYIHFIVDRSDVEILNTTHPREFFDRLRATKELAYSSQGKVEISFHGYDDDARELFEIEEVRRYVAILDRVIPELFFFVRTDEPTHMLRIFVLCQSKITQLGGRSDRQTTLTVSFKTSHLGEFLARHFAALNEMTDWLSMSEDENKKISLDVFRCLDAEASESAADP